MIGMIKEICSYAMACEFFVNFIDLQKKYLLGYVLLRYVKCFIRQCIVHPFHPY